MITSNPPHALFSFGKAGDDLFHVIIDNSHHDISLSNIMSILDNFGLHILASSTATTDHIRHTFTCQGNIPQEHFMDALQNVLQGKLANDGFNKVVTFSLLTGQQVNILRAYGRYLQQILFPYNIETIVSILAQEKELTHMLWACLENRLNKNSHTSMDDLHTCLENKNTDIQRIYHAYGELFIHTVRLYSHDAVAFKLKACNISFIPSPYPFYECFVYTPRVEGVHLRNGLISRGGIRWSERADYRTEICDLFRTQILKNSIIVPAGGKGGFICHAWAEMKRSGADPRSLQAEKVACYKVYIDALLHLVDLHPLDAPVYPDDHVDAYFVVAADKGTAGFSDLANELAQERGFWLSDAFASGGTNGYNHKSIGITAQGAWASLDHHIKRLGMKSPLTFVGVGDMSGDVFGNGLLRAVKLIAAFNHQHIFIDPTPDVEISLQERQRLFDLPQSTWADYNPALISQGGGVFERQCHSIQLSSEAAAMLNMDAGEHATHCVIQHILKASVDVLWFGGIGTYIKGAEEQDRDVHDHDNDSIRVVGHDVQASIIVEGANLGITQAGRVAYALKGGSINNDGIDNSAGVDCSDHEVNIKIFLRHQNIPEADIHAWLIDMKDDVVERVLNNNRAQNEALTFMEAESPTYEPLRQYFKHMGIRDGLPSGRQLSQRPLRQWVRPELAYLMAYMKNDLNERLTQALPHIKLDLFDQDVVRYFPTKMQEHFGTSLTEHPLRLNLVATLLSNHIVNTWGPLWALPDQPLGEWICHYQWIRSQRLPCRSEAILWSRLLVDLAQHSTPPPLGGTHA